MQAKINCKRGVWHWNIWFTKISLTVMSIISKFLLQLGERFFNNHFEELWKWNLHYNTSTTFHKIEKYFYFMKWQWRWNRHKNHLGLQILLLWILRLKPGSFYFQIRYISHPLIICLEKEINCNYLSNNNWKPEANSYRYSNGFLLGFLFFIKNKKKIESDV